MLTPNEFKNTVSEEIRIIRYLGKKVDGDQLDWRPSPKQRSTLELMRYLAFCGIAPAMAMLEKDWNLVGPYREKAQGIDGASFDGAMEDQEAELHALFDSLTEQDLAEREAPLPWGNMTTLGQGLFDCTVRFLVAYRLQLFVHLKASGDQELGTFEAWLGRDRPDEST